MEVVDTEEKALSCEEIGSKTEFDLSTTIQTDKENRIGING